MILTFLTEDAEIASHLLLSKPVNPAQFVPLKHKFVGPSCLNVSRPPRLVLVRHQLGGFVVVIVLQRIDLIVAVLELEAQSTFTKSNINEVRICDPVVAASIRL